MPENRMTSNPVGQILESGSLKICRPFCVPRLYLFVREEFCLRADALHDRCRIDEAAHKGFVGREAKRDVRGGGRGGRIARPRA